MTRRVMRKRDSTVSWTRQISVDTTNQERWLGGRHV
jgi:hypothetical protein